MVSRKRIGSKYSFIGLLYALLLLIMVQSWEPTLPQTGEFACHYEKHTKIFKILQNFGNDAEELDLLERH